MKKGDSSKKGEPDYAGACLAPEAKREVFDPFLLTKKEIPSAAVIPIDPRNPTVIDPAKPTTIYGTPRTLAEAAQAAVYFAQGVSPEAAEKQNEMLDEMMQVTQKLMLAVMKPEEAIRMFYANRAARELGMPIMLWGERTEGCIEAKTKDPGEDEEEPLDDIVKANGG